MNETAIAEMLRRATCPVTGKPDLYGLGIRIGIYLQMTVQLSAIMSKYFHVEDHISQGAVVFGLSTLIVLVRLLNASIQGLSGADGYPDNALESVEVYPIMTLLLVQGFVCRDSPVSKTTTLILRAELSGVTVLLAWFWWHGMDLLPRSCPDDVAFFFVRVSIWNWFRTLNKATATFVAIVWSLGIVVLFGGVFYWWFVFAIGLLANESATFQKKPAMYFLDIVHELGTYFIKFVSMLGTCFIGFSLMVEPCIIKDRTIWDSADGPTLILNGVVYVSAIVYVEVSLKWNNISGVHSLNSPGQFMPFVVLGQLLSVFYSAAKYQLQQVDKHGESDEHAEAG